MEFEKKIQINGFEHVLYESIDTDNKEMLAKCQEFFKLSNSRRSIREFDTTPISKKIIETIIKTASTAPSGAHKQPWTFCAISNTALKKEIRFAAEEEEKKNYQDRMSDRWKKDLEIFATSSNKPFLEEAPWLIVVFKKAFEFDENKNKKNNYYVNESVGIACGMLINAIHNAGLVTLTHTPSPMNFLAKILNRPENERPFLLLPVGLPKKITYVPNIKRKEVHEISEFYE